jgi:DNA-binding PadR family transcriptional regulator
MSLLHAILVLLAETPQSGYDLAKRFDGSVGFFWQATHQQIYRELNKLESQEWIIAQAIAQVGRPDKKLFSLTDLGISQLQNWILQPCEVAAIKEEILIKLYGGYLVSEEAIAKEISQHQHLHQQKLAAFHQIEAKFFSNPEKCSKQAKYSYLTLRLGIRLEKEWIEWCEEVREMLKSI